MVSVEDALLKARELYLRTGDVRFAAIAIGKSDFDDIPEWALLACRKYALAVADARPLRRKKTMSEGQQKRGFYENAYEMLLDRFELDHQRDFNIELDRLQADLAIPVGEIEAFRRWMKRQWRKDVAPEEPWTPDEGEPPPSLIMRHRRLHERALLTARGHLPRLRQGQK